jgi:hypothetical protein
VAKIYRSNKEINNIFLLLGENENDMTYSMGWVLAKSKSFLHGFLDYLNIKTSTDSLTVSLQKYDSDGGITDIEINDKEISMIIEAKKGAVLPSMEQLEKYAKRLKNVKQHNLMVTLTSCDSKYAALGLPTNVDGIPLVHINWKDVILIAKNINSKIIKEREMLSDFKEYMGVFVNMGKEESNNVYVVSLSKDEIFNGVTFIDVVEEYNNYFHPYGNKSGWPTESPNYLGFRYDGKLQGIAHVEQTRIINNFHDCFQSAKDELLKEPHVIYDLGPIIRPLKEVKTGKIFPSGRVWAMLDLLLTADTISEARDKSNERLKRV